MKEKGLIFDGFTYYKPQVSPKKKSSSDLQHLVDEEEYSN